MYGAQVKNIQRFFFQKCPLGWAKIYASCIWISRNEKSAVDAFEECIAMDSRSGLYQPKNEQHNNLTHEWMVQLGVTTTTPVWIGINDKVRENHFAYTKSGSQISFTNWITGQPDGGTGQNCVAIDDAEAKWRDLPCKETHLFLCELPLA